MANSGIGIHWGGSNSGNTPTFKPQGLSSSRVTSNAGSAADAVSIANTFGSIRAKSPKYDEIAGTAEDIRMAENIAGLEAEASMEVAGIQAYGAAARAKQQADMYEDQASAAKKGGMMSLFGGIAGGALSLATGGASSGIMGLAGAAGGIG